LNALKGCVNKLQQQIKPGIERLMKQNNSSQVTDFIKENYRVICAIAVVGLI
jgi:hypothetical protein